MSMLNGGFRHSQGMEHPVKNDQYRDVYNERDRKRGQRRGPTSKIPLASGVIIIMVILYAALLFVISICWYMAGITPFAGLLGIQSTQTLGLKGCAGQIAFLGNGGSILFYIIDLGIDGYLAYWAHKTWVTQNVPRDPSQINDHEGDAHIEQPEVLNEKYNDFPDAGAHSGVQVTAALSHQMLYDPWHRLQHVRIYKRYKKDSWTHDSFNRPILKHKGDVVRDKYGNPILTKPLPILDKQFGDYLYDGSFIPKDRRKWYNPYKLYYNPKGRHGKQKQKTVGQHIKQDWVVPPYERQLPAGVYITDDQPNNSIIIGKTRSAKGQTVINTTLDMWSRQKEQPNIVANDPKGELYLAMIHPFTLRGYNVMAFNLINERKTSIFNPLGYAWDAAVHGDFGKIEQIVDGLGSIFFPVTKGSDKFWAQASNLVFKRSALELIDYYLDKLNFMRDKARRERWSQNILKHREDVLGGHVTLYNTFQMMQLSQVHSTNKKLIRIKPDDQSTTKDYLTLFSEAERSLPSNGLRSLIGNADGALKAMMKSPKTVSSVYGIALTGMTFFADSKVSRLTSGRPSQNFDMASLGFPRRIQIRMAHTYMKKRAFTGASFHWNAFYDDKFTKEYKGKDFEHTGEVDQHGWISYIFKGIFKHNVTYLRLRMLTTAGVLMHTFYFKFTKEYQKSADGRTFQRNQITHKRIIRGGILQEMLYDDEAQKFVLGHTVYNQTLIPLVEKNDRSYGAPRSVNARAFIQTDIHYTEKPKAIFCVTPPNLAKYNRIILIMLDQMFNMQVSMAYMTKANQKPLYVTNYMLDEVGNLRSQGKGIPFLTTKESIGLGQGQRYTLVVQDLQQFKDIYGANSNKTIEGNTGNFIYLKSTDYQMLQELSNLSGTTHRTFHDSRSLDYDPKHIINKVSSNIHDTMAVKKTNVLSPNYLMNMPRFSQAVLGKGNPIISQNQDVMPMAYRLLGKQKEPYTLNTVPTNVDTGGFNIIENQPDIYRMVHTRVRQAKETDLMIERYKKAHHLTDDEYNHINPEIRSQDIMKNIDAQLAYNDSQKPAATPNATPTTNAGDDDTGAKLEAESKAATGDLTHQGKTSEDPYQKAATVNKSVKHDADLVKSFQDKLTNPRYARGTMARMDLMGTNTTNTRLDYDHPLTGLDGVIGEAYRMSLKYFKQDPKFEVTSGGSLFLKDGHKEFIQSAFDENSHTKEMDKLANEAKDSSNTNIKETPGEPQTDDPRSLNDANMYHPTAAFYRYLVDQPNWYNIAGGKFDDCMYDARQENHK